MSLPKFRCLQLHDGHESNDPLPQHPWTINGHKAEPKRFTFFYEPRDGRKQLRIIFPPSNQYGVFLQSPRIVGDDQDYDLMFNPGNKVVVAESNEQLLAFVRANRQWFRPATIWDKD